MKDEAFAIRATAVVNLLLGFLGLGFGVHVESDAILLDGIFNFVAFAMALATLRVARLVRQPGDDQFHFGYAFFEPFLNTIKSVIVVGVSLLALFGAVGTLLHGGRPIDAGKALVYALIAVIACFVVAAIAARLARTTGSPLVAVDAKNWLVNGAISGAVALAFLLALVMRGTAFEPYVSYVDPLLVILLVIVTLPIPSKMALQGVGQLLNVAPETAEQAEVRRQVEAALDGMEIEATSIRMAHIGRFFYVAVYVVVAPTTALGTAADLDAVRTRVNDRLREHRPALVLDVVFTGDSRWAEVAADRS